MKRAKFIIGAIIGAVAGLAFAPKKGKDLRKEFASEFKKGGYGQDTLVKNAKLMGIDIADTAKEVYNDPNVQKQLKKIQKEAEKMIEDVKKELEKKGEEWKDTAKEKIDEIKKKAVKKEADVVKKAAKAAKSKTRKIPVKKK